jgi:hypothetical protein
MINMLKRSLQALEKFWFAPGSAVTLAILRLITGGFALWLLVTWRQALVRSSRGIFHPIGVARFLDQPLPRDVYDGLFGVTIFLAGLFVAGVWHRVLAPIFAVMLLFVLTYSNSWVMVYHTENMLVLHVFVLAVTPSASALSVDASYSASHPWLRRLGFSPAATEEPQLRFGWPVRVMQLATTLPYVVAGLAKLRGKMGWEWGLGHNLRDQITMNGLYYEMLSGGAGEVTFHVYGWDVAFMVAAMGSLILEIGAPIAILHRRLGYAWVLGVLGLHWSILVLMGIPFRYQLWGCAFACFLPWDWIIAFIQARTRRLRRAPETVLEDTRTAPRHGELHEETRSSADSTGV